MSSSIEITPELLAGFLDEAPEYLEMLDEGLMEFETQVSAGTFSLDAPEDQDRMNTMFRAAHSLKGLAAAFGFDRIKELTHLMETLFDQIRMKKRTLFAEGIETLFQVFDRLKLLVQELADDSGDPVEIDDVLAALEKILGSEEGVISENPVASTTAVDAAPTASAAEPSPSPSETTSPDVTTPLGTDSQESTVDAVETTSEPIPTEPSVTLEQNEVFSDPELAAIFVETTTEAIEEMNQGLLGLEENPSNSDLLNKVFRCAHNIKGASGAAGLTGMNRLTHDLETVFDRLRLGLVTLDETMMNAIFKASDRMRVVLDQIREGQIIDVGPTELGDLFAPWTTRTEGASETVSAPSADEIATTSTTEGDSSTPPVDLGDGPQEGLCKVIVTFPENFDEAAIQAYLIHNKLGDLGNVLSSDPDLDALPADAVLDKVVFTIQPDGEPEEIKQIIATYSVKDVMVIEGIEVAASTTTSTPNTGSTASAIEPTSPLPEPVTTPSSLTASAPTPPPASPAPTPAPTPVASAAPVTQKLQTPPAKPAAPKPVAKSKSKAKKTKADATPTKTTETLRVDQERLDHLMNLGGELVINRARFIQIHSRFREVFDGKNLGYLVENINERLLNLGTELELLQSGDTKHDHLEAMQHELTHLKGNIYPIRSLVQRVHDLRTSMTDFDEALHGLTRVSESIQKGIMGTRMVPIGPLFNRFRRVIRDISKSNGKKIELVLKGEHTELDKRMIDELGDPLTHMVRNSVDHGIESPEERTAAGKNPTGTLILEAGHRGNNICITVTDDGAGINVERVKAKIIENELATPAQVEQMSHKELLQFIFRPGFSTAEKVTEVSGRGMGMDIVVNKIEKLSGTIEVDSTPGQGTVVVVKLPLTLAILTSLVTRIGKGIYAIPLETVAEIITIRRDDIQYIQKREVVRIRDRVVPIARFEDVVDSSLEGLQTVTRDLDELTLVIIGFEDDKLGLVVDDLLGQEDVVIKSIAENYTNVRGIAGASIRGDGTVSLILDVGAMMEMASKSTPHTTSRELQPVGAMA